MYLYFKRWEPLHFPAPVNKLQIYDLVFDSGGIQVGLRRRLCELQQDTQKAMSRNQSIYY